MGFTQPKAHLLADRCGCDKTLYSAEQLGIRHDEAVPAHNDAQSVSSSPPSSYVSTTRTLHAGQRLKKKSKFQ